MCYCRFNNKLYLLIYFCIFSEIPVIEGLDASAQSTRQLCLFVDKLFDSANGISIKPEPGKNLRSAVIRNSSYWDYWQKALITLNSMKYLNTNKEIVSSITNWIKKIKGIMPFVNDFLIVALHLYCCEILIKIRLKTFLVLFVVMESGI